MSVENLGAFFWEKTFPEGGYVIFEEFLKEGGGGLKIPLHLKIWGVGVWILSETLQSKFLQFVGIFALM